MNGIAGYTKEEKILTDLFPIKDEKEVHYYFNIVEYKINEEGYWSISFEPNLKRLIRNYREEVNLDKEFIYIRNSKENIWLPLLSNKKTNFNGKGMKGDIIKFDLKVLKSYLAFGNYELSIVSTFENLISSKDKNGKKSPLVLKKEYSDLKDGNIKVRVYLYNNSKDKILNLKIKENFYGKGKIIKPINFIPYDLSDKSFSFKIDEIKGGEEKILEYLLFSSILLDYFYTETELEGFLEEEYFRIIMQFPYISIEENLSGRGGIIGIVFYDKNCDGVREKDEEGLPFIELFLSNGKKVLTDEKGRFSFKNLLPNHYSIYYIYKGIIHYFDTIYLNSFGFYNVFIPLKIEDEEEKKTNFFSLASSVFFAKDGFFGKNFQLFSNYEFSSNYLEFSYDSKEEKQKDFLKEILNYSYNFPLYGDSSLEYESSRLKRKFSFIFQNQDMGFLIYYGFSRGTFLNSNFLKYNYLSEGLNISYNFKNFYLNFSMKSLIGKKVSEILIPNYTIGPFYLSYKPILYFSEEVYLEVRDKVNEERVLKEDFLKRNLDYFIDYKYGIINFTNPIPSKTSEGNPILIRVIYQKEIENIKDKNFSYALEFSYKNNGIRFLEINAIPKSEKYFEFFGKKKNLEYSYSIEDINFKKKAFRIDYNSKKLRFYIQSIDKFFKNPSEVPIGDGIKEVGTSFYLKNKRVGFFYGIRSDKNKYFNLFFEYPYKKLKINHSVQYEEKEKKLFFSNSIFEDLWEIHFSKAFENYFFSYLLRKEKYNFELKLDRFKDYNSLKSNLKIRNFNIYFSKDFKEKGMENFEISYNFGKDINSFLQASYRIERGDKNLYKFFILGKKFYEFNRFFVFLDGRASLTKNKFYILNPIDGNVYLNYIFGIRPLFEKKLILFIQGDIREEFGENDKKEEEKIFGLNYSFENFNFKFSGMKEKKANFLNSKIDMNLFNNFSIYFIGNYYKELYIKNKSFGIGFSIEKEKNRFLIGYNFSNFPHMFNQEKFMEKKGFYIGAVIPIFEFKSFEIKEKFKFERIEVKGNYFGDLGSPYSIKIITEDINGKPVNYMGVVYLNFVNEKGNFFEKKIKFKEMDKGEKEITIIFEKEEDEGSWVLTFYDKEKRQVKGSFNFYIKRKEIKNLFSFEPPKMFFLEKMELEKECVPRSIEIETPNEATCNIHFNIKLKIKSAEGYLCDNYKGKIFLYLSDGERILKEPIIFEKNDKGVKEIEVKIEKEGDFFIIGQDEKNLNLTGISKIILIRSK